MVDGLFETLDTLQSLKTPVTATCFGVTASAAYVIATQAKEIYANHKSSMFGSFGVAATFKIDENELSITNRESPDKRPDPNLEAGKEVIRDQLDDVFNLTLDYVMKGRGHSRSFILENYGKGRVYLAEKALQHKLIDKILKKGSAMGSNMSQQNQSVEHDTKIFHGTTPALQPTAKTDDYKAGYEQGIIDERDRAKAHIELANVSGGFKIALEAIANGDFLTQSMTAKHQAIAMQKNLKQAYIDEDEELEEVTQVTKSPKVDNRFERQAVNAFLKLNGKSPIEG